VITAGGGNDRINAGAGDDLLVGQAGSDLLDGRGGHDVFAGMGGNDRYLGAAGFDLITFELSTGPVAVNLAAGSANGEGSDYLSGMEAVYGSVFNDTIRGDAGSNALAGGPGDDLIDGLEGTDLVFYLFSTSGVTANLTAGIATDGEGNDTLTSMEDALGSDFDDSLTGTTTSNYLNGWEGEDTIDGGGGDDICIGEFVVACPSVEPPPADDVPTEEAPPPPPPPPDVARATAGSSTISSTRAPFLRRQIGSDGMLDLDALDGARATLAVRWDHVGQHTCWGGAPTAWGPIVGSSGHVAWIPKFVWISDVVGRRDFWGGWMWAYRDSAWRHFNTGIYANSQVFYDGGPGILYVQNWVWDYDSSSYTTYWSRSVFRDPLTGGYVDSGYLYCRLEGAF
jgi:Ca2+-binding RTX toxin-like protein